MTGSATASHILFSDLQAETALLLGRPVAAMAGAQGFGATAGSMDMKGRSCGGRPGRYSSMRRPAG